MTTPIANVDNTTLNNLTPNLDTGDVADPALRKAAFQYIYAEMQTIITAYNAFIAAGGVATGNLADLSVTTAKLADLAVTTGKIPDLAIVTAKINDLAVTAAKIALGTITSAQIADLGIATGDLADALITTAKLADLNVTTGKLADASVTLAKMAAASVGTTQLVDGSITGPKIAPATITADKFVAGALNNDTQNGLLITALSAEIATVHLSQSQRLAGETDDTGILQRAIDYVVANGGGDILISEPIYITNVQFKGTMSNLPPFTAPWYGILKLIGTNNGAILAASTKTSGSLLSFGDTTTNTTCVYKVMIENLVVDCQTKNIVALDGAIGVGNSAVEMTNVWIKGMQGADAIGLYMGRMAGCKFTNMIIEGYGTRSNIGIKAGRESNQLINCSIRYCINAVYIVNASESCVKMIGGDIMVCDNILTYEGGGYLSANSYFKGTYMAEPRTGYTIVKVITTTGFNTPLLSFESCVFSVDTPTDGKLIDLGQVNGNVSITDCTAWTNSTNFNINIGAFTLLKVSGNSKLTYEGNLQNLNKNVSTQKIINFSVDGLANNGSSYHAMILPYAIDRILSIGAITQGLASGTLDIQITKNSLTISGLTASNIINGAINDGARNYSAGSFAKGDILGIYMYATGLTTPYKINVTLLCLVDS